MTIFESFPITYQNTNYRLSLKIDQQFSLIYHQDHNFTKEIINYFNYQRNIHSGSVIIDKITINNLDVAERRNFFANYCNYYLNFLNFNKNLTIHHLLQDFKRIYPHHLSTHEIERYCELTGLQNKLHDKLKNLSELENFYVSFLICLLKYPKVIIIEENAFLQQHQETVIKNVLEILAQLKIDVNVLWFTNNTTLTKTSYCYDLTDNQYFEINNCLTIYTSQNLLLSNKKNLVAKMTWFKYLSFHLIKQHRWAIILNLFLGFAVVMAGILLRSQQITKVMDIFSYVVPWIGIITMIALVIYPVYFKHNQFLINLNISGFSHISTILNTILFFTILSIIPVLPALLIVLVMYYASDIIDYLAIKHIIYPILCYFLPIIITAFIFSIKLRININ